MLKFYNYLTRKVEDFKPIKPKYVGIYTCGPTVYNFAHIGNLRTFIFEDILQRVLEVGGYEVKRVMNITDIDDKIIKNAKEKGLFIEEFVKPYELGFYEDLNKLNIKPADVYPKATEHIGQMIKYIEELIKKSLAYLEKDGSVYFDISKFPDYGKLSQLDKREIKAGVRVKADEYGKDDVQDFALWKAVEASEVGYDSPWGFGRPGWHIECSVMSQQYLGDSFDIHGGGVDLIFPHHENEIAQAEGKTGKKFVNFFVEGEHLLIDGQKMSKSLKNDFTLRDIERREFNPLAFRYLVLTAHYRDKLNFTWESLQSAQNTLNNLREIVRDWELPNVIARNPAQPETKQSDKNEIATLPSVARNDKEGLATAENYYQRFLDALNNDLNTPQALAVMWEMIKSDKLSSDKAITILEMDKVLGLKLEDYVGRPIEVPEKVQKLLGEREKARENKDFEKSDQIRKEIKNLGYEVDDTTEGPKVKMVS